MTNNMEAIASAITVKVASAITTINTFTPRTGLEDQGWVPPLTGIFGFFLIGFFLYLLFRRKSK